MSRLTNNSLPCERARGLVFSETMRSASDVALNGGRITDTTFSDGWADFNGTSSNIEYYFANQGGQAGVTFTSWVDAGTLPTSGYHRFIRIETTGVTNSNFYAGLYYTGGQLYIQAGAIMGGGHAAYEKAVSLSDNQIFHFAFRCDGTNMEAFVDGVSLGTQSNSGTWAGGNEFYLGSFSGLSEFFAGKLKDPKFWLVALTDQEILDYANNATWNYRNKAKHAFYFRPEDYDITNSQFLNRGSDGTAGSIGGTVTYDSDGGMKRTGSISMANAGYIGFGSGSCSVSDGNSFSYSARIFGSSDTDLYIFSSGSGGTGVDWFSCYVTSGDIQANIDDGSSILSTTAFTLPKGWHDITVVGTLWTTMDIYLDGELKDSLDISGLSGDCNGNNCYIGTRFPNAAYNFTGEIDSFVFWDKRLTPLQILDIAKRQGYK